MPDRHHFGGDVLKRRDFPYHFDHVANISFFVEDVGPPSKLAHPGRNCDFFEFGAEVHELDILFEGILKGEFLEGETLQELVLLEASMQQPEVGNRKLGVQGVVDLKCRVDRLQGLIVGIVVEGVLQEDVDQGMQFFALSLEEVGRLEEIADALVV